VVLYPVDKLLSTNCSVSCSAPIRGSIQDALDIQGLAVNGLKGPYRMGAVHAAEEMVSSQIVNKVTDHDLGNAVSPGRYTVKEPHCS